MSIVYMANSRKSAPSFSWTRTHDLCSDTIVMEPTHWEKTDAQGAIRETCMTGGMLDDNVRHPAQAAQRLRTVVVSMQPCSSTAVVNDRKSALR